MTTMPPESGECRQTEEVSALPSVPPGEETLQTLAEVSRVHTLRVLVALGGNMSQAARTLGIDRRTLYRKMVLYRRQTELETGVVNAGDGQPQMENAGASAQ